MFQWLKYLIFAGAIIAVIVAAGFFYNQQNASITSAQEVNSTLQTNITGHFRTMKDQGIISKKEVATNIIMEAVASQKSNQKPLKIEFVFLDQEGKSTEMESKIKSVQIRTSVLNDKGEAETEAVQRISFKQQ